MRMLNTGKGPAVRALRAQADKVLYQQEMKRVIEDEENLHIMQGMVDELIIENDEVKVYVQILVQNIILRQLSSQQGHFYVVKSF